MAQPRLKPELKLIAPILVKSERRTLTKSGALGVTKYAKPPAGSITALLAPSPGLRVRDPTRVKSDKRTFMITAGSVFVPKYAKPPPTSITAEGRPSSPLFRTSDAARLKPARLILF